MRPTRPVFEPSSERDSVLREVGQVLALARSVSLGPEFDDIIRTAVERAIDRLMAATRRRTDRLATLSAIQQTVAVGFDLPAIMAGVYEHLREIIDAPSFVVASYDAAAGGLRCSFAVADGEIVSDRPFPTLPLGDGPVSQVVRTGRPRIVSDALTEPGFAGRRLFTSGDESQPVRSVLYVPMYKGDDVIGVMQAQSYHPDAYGPEEVEFLSTVANQTAMALENTRLYREALRRSREVEALLAAAQELGTELEPEPVLRRIVEAAAHLVDAEIATIGITTHNVYAAGGTPPVEQRDAAPQSPACGVHLRFDRVWQDGAWHQVHTVAAGDDDACGPGDAGQPVLDNQPGPDTAGPLGGLVPEVRSRLVVPFLGRDKRVLGAIALFNKRNRQGFASRDVELTAAFASHAAMALERANAFRTVQESRNYLQTLMDRTYSSIFMLDPLHGRLLNVNTAGIQLLGRERDEVLGQRIVDLAPASDHTAWHTVLREAQQGGEAVQHELHVLARDGSAIPLDITVTRINVDDAPAIVCLGRDRRPRIRREEAERLRALGEMASGVAHDFNNLLGVILGRTELMIGRTGAADRAAQADLAVIRQMALDGAETVKRLQAFSGVARLTQHDVSDVNKVLSDAVEFTRPRWKDGAQQRGVTLDVGVEPSEVPPVAAGAPELREVLINMIFNAVDAMPHGGRITLRSWAEGGRVFISVADTGIGMPEAVRGRIFEPFFTTKGTHGSGLGLSASYGIISRMGGRIAVESAPYQGTTFTIDLPAGEALPAAVAAPQPEAVPLTLLLVDDEPQMLRTTKLMLEAEGHRVTAVPGGRAAIDALTRDRFDAVLTDLGMPEINGLQLTEMIRAGGHTVPVMLITGWGMELEADRVHAVGVTEILPKPFDGERLRAKLATLTGAGC